MRPLLAPLILLCAAPATGQAVKGERMTDPELAEARGGFDLPGGITVTLGVTTDTRIDGQEVLRTVFSVDQGGPRIAVLGSQNGGLAPVGVDANGAGVITRDGVVRLRSSGENSRVELAGSGVDITHLVGRSALGTIVANATDNRSIEVNTSVDIGLSGIRPDQVGSAMTRVDTLALDATGQLVR